MTVLRVEGEGAWELFKNEGCGHRVQRIPPTETKGRRHSSTFTVAVFIDEDRALQWNASDVKLEATRGHGPGGQHRNKTATAIRAVHAESGTSVFIQGNRSQKANKAEALEVMQQRMLQKAHNSSHKLQNASRQEQVGSGERSDKGRTVQEQHGCVTDHRTGKKCTLAAYNKGEIWRLQ